MRTVEELASRLPMVLRLLVSTFLYTERMIQLEYFLGRALLQVGLTFEAKDFAPAYTMRERIKTIPEDGHRQDDADHPDDMACVVVIYDLLDIPIDVGSTWWEDFLRLNCCVLYPRAEILCWHQMGGISFDALRDQLRLIAEWKRQPPRTNDGFNEDRGYDCYDCQCGCLIIDDFTIDGPASGFDGWASQPNAFKELLAPFAEFNLVVASFPNAIPTLKWATKNTRYGITVSTYIRRDISSLLVREGVVIIPILS